LGERTPAASSGAVIARALSWGGVAGFLAGAAIASRQAVTNDYLGAGLRRIILFDLVEGTTRGVLLGCALFLFAALLFLVLRWRGRLAGPSLAASLAAGAVLPAFLAGGYLLNRHLLKEYWKSSDLLLGVRLPSGLVEPFPLLLNGLVTAGAVGLLLLLAFLLRRPAAFLADRFPCKQARHPFFRCRALLLVLILLVLGNVWVARARRAPGTPVLLVSIDTLRADHVHCYGYGRETSPAIDAIAAEGVRFAHCISQAPVTLPSHITMLTSLYPTVHGVVTGSSRLADRTTTLAEVLRDEGYATAAFVDGGYMMGRFGFRQGFQAYHDRTRGIAVLRREAMAWISRRGGERSFCFLHCYDVHSPYDPPPPYDTLFEDEPYRGDFVPTNPNLNRYDRYYQGQGGEKLDPLTGEDVAHMISLYDGGIRYSDEELSRLFTEMKGTGVYDETLIIITSDHGEEFLEHRTLLHSELYYTVIRVPLLIKPPAGAAWAEGLAGAVVETPVELVDLLPTIAAALGADPPGGIAGMNLLPLLRGAGADPGPAFSEHRWKGRLRAVTTPTYRFVGALDQEKRELYLTSEDPLEQRDLAGALPEKAAELEGLLAGWMDEQERVRAARGASVDSAPLDAATIEQLRALGYVE